MHYRFLVLLLMATLTGSTSAPDYVEIAINFLRRVYNLSSATSLSVLDDPTVRSYEHTIQQSYIERTSRGPVRRWQESQVTIAETAEVKIRLNDTVQRVGLTRNSQEYIVVTQHIADDWKQATSAGTDVPPGTIRVMTANIFNFNHWNRRIDVLGDALGGNVADVICFQEVRALIRGQKSSFTEQYQVETLARLLPGYQFVFLPAMLFEEHNQGDAHWVHEGLAIFSRLPVVEVHELKLTRDKSDSQDFHQRLLIGLTVKAKEGLVNVFSTHLSLSSKARKRSLKEIGAYLAELTGPSLVLGDFNDEMKKNSRILNRYGLVDAWEEFSPNDSGYTFNTFNGLKKRIDLVYRSEGLSTVGVELRGLNSREIPSGVELEPGGGVEKYTKIYPSDHAFVLAEFTIDRRQDPEQTHTEL